MYGIFTYTFTIKIHQMSVNPTTMGVKWSLLTYRRLPRLRMIWDSPCTRQFRGRQPLGECQSVGWHATSIFQRDTKIVGKPKNHLHFLWYTLFILNKPPFSPCPPFELFWLTSWETSKVRVYGSISRFGMWVSKWHPRKDWNKNMDLIRIMVLNQTKKSCIAIC